MTKIVLDDTGSGYNLSRLNDNFDKIEDALQERVLWRDNPEGEPNHMEQELDMNGNRITNLPFPVGISEPVTLGYLSQVGADVNALGTVASFTYTATGGEDTIDLPFTYALSANSIHVFLNGIKLVVGVDFFETDNDTVTLTNPLLTSDIVDVVGLGIVLSAESEVGANLGIGEGVYEGKTGNTLRFKSLVAGNNVSFSSDATSISIDVSASGEINTASNVGGGSGVFKQKDSVDLQFKTLVAGANVTLTPATDTITIAAAGAAGETNTLGSAGGTASLAAAKTGTQLNVKGLTAGNGISFSTSATDVTVSTTAWTLSGSNAYRSSGKVLVGATTDIPYTVFAGTTPLNSGHQLQIKEGAFLTRTAASNSAFDNTLTLYRDGRAISGGTPGSVNSNLYVNTLVGASQTAFEWGVLSVLNNFCNAGDSVSMYAQAQSYGAGPTFGFVAETRAFPGSTGALIGMEVDCYPDSTNPNPSSVGIDIVTGNGDGSATPVSITAGLRLSTGVNPTTAKFQIGVDITQCSNVGINITGTSTATAINIQGTNTVGISTTGATLTGPSLRMASGQFLSFEPTDARRLSYRNYSGFGDVLGFSVGSAAGDIRWGVDSTGRSNQSGSIFINGTQVVTSKQSWPGVWSNVDVSSWVTANVDMSTITDALLNSVTQATATRPLWNYVANIVTVLKTHGLMG